MNGDAPKDFARAFGDHLNDFLRRKGIKQIDASRLTRLDKARLNTYCHDSPKGKRAKPDAEALYLICVNLGFEFEYNGFRISAASLNGGDRRVATDRAEQLPFEFDRQFDLTDSQGRVSVMFKKPNGRVEVSIALEAAS